MTASKYWGEERHADAVYAVMLKKVRYVPPSDYEGIPPIGQLQSSAEAVTAADGGGDESSAAAAAAHNQQTTAAVAAVDHLQWETIRERVIKAGTVQKLVESLIDADGQMDSRQFNVFFATYRAFSNAAEVFRQVTDLYTKNGAAVGEEAEETRRSLRAVLMCWLEMYPEDFYEQQQQQLKQHRQQHNNNGVNNRSSVNNSNASAGGGVAATAAALSPPLFRFPTLEALIDFARAHALHDLKQKGKRVRERLRRVAHSGGLGAQLPSIARYSFAITGYDPNEATPTTAMSISPATMSPAHHHYHHTSGGPQPTGAKTPGAASTAAQLVDEDERYARALASAQERAQMFDPGTDNVPQIAEQLTLWDALFFRELRPYQCQGAIWGRRHKTGNGPVYSVRATIDQFNALSERVMTSIVLPECRPDQRARIVEKWVEVARELRAQRNFSALKATISALQSEPVFRLKQCWAQVSKRHLGLLNELRSIFELDAEDGTGGKQKARRILETEGTAKVSPLKMGGGTVNGTGGDAFRRTKSDLNLTMLDGTGHYQQQGTVPWLGTFLTDLEKLDQLYPDMTPDGLHNFEKRRKEFEVLAEIRLFQSAARSYTIQMDQAFCVWFHFLPALNEKECFARSVELEPLLLLNNNHHHHHRHNISNNSTNNNNNSPSTPSPAAAVVAAAGSGDESSTGAAMRRRGVRDGLNMHSLGRFLSALSATGGGGQSKDLDNSPQQQAQQQQQCLLDDVGTTTGGSAVTAHHHHHHRLLSLSTGGRRGSVSGCDGTISAAASGGIDLVDSGSFCSGACTSSTGDAGTPIGTSAAAFVSDATFGASFEKKPPRGSMATNFGAGASGVGGGCAGRSQSQGAKKAHRAVTEAMSSRRGSNYGPCSASSSTTAPTTTTTATLVSRRGNASPSPARAGPTGGGSVPPPATSSASASLLLLQQHNHQQQSPNHCCHHRHRLSQQHAFSSSATTTQCGGSEFSGQQQQLALCSPAAATSTALPSSSRCCFVATPTGRRPTSTASSSSAAPTSDNNNPAGRVEFVHQACATIAAGSSKTASSSSTSAAADLIQQQQQQQTISSSSQGSSFNSSAGRFNTPVAGATPSPKCRNSVATTTAAAAAAGCMMMSPITSIGVEQNGGGDGSALRRSHNESTGSSAGGGLRRLHQQQFSQKSISSTSSRSSMGALSSGGSKMFGGASPSSISMSNGPREEQNFHLVRVGFDDTLQGELMNAATINYKCIKVENGDRMPQLIERALDKHLMDPAESPNYCLVQLLPDGSEFLFPDHCNPFYAVAPDPSSPMLACVLRKRRGGGGGAIDGTPNNNSLASVLNCSSGSTRSAATAMLALQQQQQHNNSNTGGGGGGGTSSALARKLNKQKRNNLLRWSSGFL